MKRLYEVERVALFYTGIHVRHAHAHVVPMHHPHDVSSAAYLADGVEGYSLPPQLPPEEMARIAEELRASIVFRVRPGREKKRRAGGEK
jgi:histidine triad (HIT) family protein